MNSEPDFCKIHNLAISAFCKGEKLTLCSDCVATHSKEKHKIFYFPEIVTRLYRSFVFLGKGGFGIVFRAENQFTKVQKAIKILKISKEDSTKTVQYNLKNIKNEVRILDEMKHKHVVHCNDVHMEDSEDSILVIIIMEFCETSLKSFLQKQIDPGFKLSMIDQIALGVQYLHQNGVIHCDLKPDNIFMKENSKKKKKGDYEIKIGDFGISILMGPESISLKKREDLKGTPFYMSPEVWNNEKYDRKTDVWACGIIFYEILFGKHPYLKENEKMDRYLILNRIKGREAFEFSKSLYSKERKYRRLIEKCLELDRKKRFSSDEMVEEINRIKIEEEEQTILNAREIEKPQTQRNQIKDDSKSKNHIQKDLREPFLPKPSETTFGISEATGTLQVDIYTETLPNLNPQKKIQVVQSDFDDSETARPRLNPASKQNFQNKIREMRQTNEWSSIKFLKLKIEQSTYNPEYINEICMAIEALQNIESLDLSLNNKIVYVESNPSDCICFYALCVMTFGVILALGKKSPCDCSGFYCQFNEGVDYRNAGKGVITNKELKKICTSIGTLQKLKVLKLDLRYNAITSFGLLTNLRLLNEGVKQMDVDLKFSNQLSDFDYGEIQELKDKQLWKLGHFKIDL